MRGQRALAQVAAAADVAPGTVRNHFGSVEDLATAVAAHVMALLQMPGAEIFDGIDDQVERLAALARAMAAYYERSQPWYRMADLDDRPIAAWAEAGARYDAEYAALVREALGPLGAADDAVEVVAALLDPAVFGALARRGRTGNDAAELLGAVLGRWLEGIDLRR